MGALNCEHQLRKKQTIQTSQKGNPGASISNLFQDRFEELQTYLFLKFN
jgi:hypothetical protein